MEVTCSNFSHLYPEIEQVIKCASFVAIDVEFLGLDVEETSRKCTLFDSADERYAKISGSVKRFPPAQLGLAFFTASDDPEEYNVNVYNVYLYKQGLQKQEFDFSVASMSFLKDNDFDFNKFVVEGVSHLNLDELDAAMHSFQDSYDGIESFGSNMRSLLNRVQLTVNQKIARYRRKSTGSEGAHSRSFEPFVVKLNCESLNNLQKSALLYKLYHGVPGVKMRLEGNSLICDSARLTKKDLVDIKQGLLKGIRKELMGVSEVIMSIIEKGLPVVGHNTLHDLMYLYHYFIADLPDKYNEFKKAVNIVFPQIVDTKHVAEECTHKLSWHGIMSHRLVVLGSFFDSPCSEACSPKINFNFAHELTRRSNGKRDFHNAGYDAATTGKLFLRLAHLVGKPMHIFDCGSLIPFDKLLETIQPLSNRIPVPLLGIPYVNLVGEDPPSRKPGEVTLEILEDGSIASLHQELKEQFGSWRCNVRVEGDVVRVASNTETTSRRVFNYLLSRSCYRVIDIQPSPPSSFSSPYRSPSPRNFSSGSCDSLDSITSTNSQSSTESQLYKWVFGAGSLLITAHILAKGSQTLF